MKLIEPFEYIDPTNRRWPVPAGTIVDGASIPKIFWSAIGGPFEGPYRNASVIHDYYCDARTRKFKEVHRVFYDGMLTSGVGEKKAWFMFQAVDQFGPSWADPKIDPRCEIVDDNYDFERCAKNSAKPALAQPEISKDALLAFAKQMEGTASDEDLLWLRRSAAELAR